MEKTVQALVDRTRARLNVKLFPAIVARLKQIANQFLDHVYAMDATFVSDATLDELPQPSCLGKTKIGGIDINRPRTRTVLNAAMSLSCAPRGFTVGNFAATVLSMKDSTLLQYDARRVAYDLKKLRGQESPDQAGPFSPILHSVRCPPYYRSTGQPGSGYTDPLNRKLDYGKANSSVGQEFRANGIVELQIGPNRRSRCESMR